MESSKVSVLLRELENLRDFGAKSIVFSQWTGFLDLLEIPLSRYSSSMQYYYFIYHFMLILVKKQYNIIQSHPTTDEALGIIKFLCQ